MPRIDLFQVHPGWKILLTDMGLRPMNVLRRAGLPGDLWSRQRVVLTTDEYFRLWAALEAEADDPALPLRMGAALSMEVFDPPVFAAFCSPDLNTALTRMASYKRQIVPTELHVDIGAETTTLQLEWLADNVAPPASLVGLETVFFVQLVRMATRTRICPVRVEAPLALEPREAYAEYFGVYAQHGPRPLLAFSAADATLPFLTANDEMWQSFQLQLETRLADLDATATATDRVRAVLLELLPSGVASLEATARRLGTSVRTLQRRLQREQQSFQGVLNRTRQDLACHYLKTSDMTCAEISFLLGFEDPNSFFRAFHAWTGQTPERLREKLQGPD